MKQLLAQQLLDCSLVYMKIHFKPMIAKFVAVLLHGDDALGEFRANDNVQQVYAREAFSLAAKVCVSRWSL